MFIVLLNFSSYLETKCMSLNNEPCMVGPTPIDLKYYPFMNCNGSCNVLSPERCVPKTQKTCMLKYLIW